MRDFLPNRIYNIALVILLFATSAFAAQEFDAYRLIQFSEDGNLFGSQSATINFPAVHFSDSVYRNVAVIHLNDFVEGVIEDIINSKPLGLVILLPETDDSKLNAETRTLWNEAQGTLSTNQLNIPIFFSEETAESKKLYTDLKREANAKSDVPDKKKKRM